MSTTCHTDLLRLWFNEVWNKNNLAVVDELLAPGVTFEGPLQSFMGPDVDYKEIIQTLKALLQDFRVTVTHAITQGDWASARIRVERVGTAVSDRQTFTGQLMVRVENGQFVEFLSDFDYFRMYENLGQLPRDSMEICLTGARLTWAD